jgi:hypothetical protein
MKTLKFHWSNLFTTLPLYHLITISLFLLFSTGLDAQNEANIWKIPVECGLDFNTGDPVVIDGFFHGGFGNATISDSLGNFLFAAYSFEAYSKNGPLPNSEGLAYGGRSGTVIVKWPGKDRIYYIFCAGEPEEHPGFYYSLVDMKLLDGQGYVTEKNIEIESGYDVGSKIGIVKKEGTESVWVITRKLTEDAIASYLVDENGLNPNPVLSAMPDREALSDYDEGNLKISPNKKILIVSYRWRSGYGGELEVCTFNSENGTSEYVLTHKNLLSQNNHIRGFEYSPDSKLLYVSFGINSDSTLLYQFEMQYITDSAMFKNSGQFIGTGEILDLQLARDGKIYCGQDGDSHGHLRYYLDVIHKPWISGLGCTYENDAVNQSPHYLHGNLPNILVDYLFRFEWAGEACQGYPIHFNPNFIPTPDSIVWHFGELAPGSVTTELSPTYSFKYPGVHEVKVDVWYPSGRYEHTSREIEISPSPQPDLGPDTLICNGASITLNANCEADFFTWSTGQWAVSSITVSDSGTYWVKGKFSGTGCEGYDTIHVGFHPPVQIDETLLIVTPTTCNSASGSITGLTALGSPPYTYQWLDLSGNPFGTNIDATNLPAGQYQLTITDGNGCETISDVYTIEDAGNLQVLDVELIQPHCGRPDGQVVVHGFSPSASALEFSIDDGASYSSDSVFTGLSAGNYVIRIRDINGCEGFYLSNPVFLANIPGPQVQPPVVTDETDFLGNGSIEITATGSTPQIFFSIDNGST